MFLIVVCSLCLLEKLDTPNYLHCLTPIILLIHRCTNRGLQRNYCVKGEKGCINTPYCFIELICAFSIVVTLFSFSIQPPQSLASLLILFHPTPLLRLSVFIQAYTLYLFTPFQRITMLYLKQGSPPQSLPAISTTQLLTFTCKDLYFKMPYSVTLAFVTRLQVLLSS